jgi:phosphoribosylformylglycinamidine cyclo-ligase
MRALALAKISMSTAQSAYKDAGVDIDLSHDLLNKVKGKLAATRRPEMLQGIGGFGGLFQLDLSRYKEPVLVSSIDGVGTKLMVACLAGRHSGVGHDIVNHCVNDIAVVGAEPLYFMDYVGIGKLRSPLYEEVLGGIAEACSALGVAVLGGETAEMPGMYGDDYDLVGVISGVVEKSGMITGEAIAPGHALIGLASNGLHTNGYSLARKILFEQSGYTVESELPELDATLGEVLLRPHTCYLTAIRVARSAGLPLNGIAHITGGGLYDNIPRILPDGTGAAITTKALPRPPIFDIIQQRGNIGNRDMFHAFNMGFGMIWMVPATAADSAIELAGECGFDAAHVGEVVSGAGVTVDGEA